MGLNDVSSPACSDIPLLALRPKTRHVFSQLLNRTKLLDSPEGLPRDWRGLAHLTGYDNSTHPSDSHCDHVKLVLDQWEKKKPSPNVKQLLDFTSQLDRWDVLDDVSDLIEEDIKEYLKRKDGTAECENDRWKADAQILTVDDTYRIEQGYQPQFYDAFLLYAYEDEEYAMKIVDILENTHNCKLCLKDRDLVGGLLFEHDAIMQLIAERCNRLIIIISEAFLNSQFNKFFVTFAQALGIEQGQRKIIPCIFKTFTLPHQLRHYCSLNFERNIPNDPYAVWNKLVCSVTRHLSPIVYRRPLRIMAPEENNKIFQPEKLNTPDSDYNRKQKPSESETIEPDLESLDIKLESPQSESKSHCLSPGTPRPMSETHKLNSKTPEPKKETPQLQFPDVPSDPVGGSVRNLKSFFTSLYRKKVKVKN